MLFYTGAIKLIFWGVFLDSVKEHVDGETRNQQARPFVFCFYI